LFVFQIRAFGYSSIDAADNSNSSLLGWTKD
jgi:hypothetical protein